MRRTLLMILALAACALPLRSLASNTSSTSVAPLFAERAPLPIELEGPFATIDQQRDKDETYRGKVTWSDASGTRPLPLKLEVRGNFRLRENVCDHVPLWLDFDKDEVDGTPFAGQNRLKLVVQCRDYDSYQGYVAREEQIYRMFAELSDISLKTRLAWVTYRDSESGETRRQLGLLLQHHKRLAKAQNLDIYEGVSSFRRARLDPGQSALVSTFMFMIANTDYSMAQGRPDDDCCHNTKPLIDESGTVYPLPYDFDSTGYVDAQYAEVPANVKQRSVTQRVYRGYCAHNDALPAAFARFREKKTALLAIAAEQEYQSARDAKKAVRFIEKFFDIIDSDSKVRWEITSACLG